MTERPSPGLGGCPECGIRVLYALSAAGDLIALDEGQDGPVAVRWDRTGTPRVRPVKPGYQTGDGEHRFRLHSRSCIALAPVADLAAERDRRRCRPDPGRRRASAR